jgi:hypothetical protein
MQLPEHTASARSVTRAIQAYSAGDAARHRGSHDEAIQLKDAAASFEYLYFRHTHVSHRDQNSVSMGRSDYRSAIDGVLHAKASHCSAISAGQCRSREWLSPAVVSK